MRSLLFIIPLLFWASLVFAQKETVTEQGAASYVSSQNVYVKFASTELIQKGDTLFTRIGDILTPALLVKDKSSTSCVCTPLGTAKSKVGDLFFSRSIVEKKPEKTKEEKKNARIAARDSTLKTSPLVRVPIAGDKEDGPEFKEKIKGRISAASYSNFYGDEVTHRMRYTLTFQGNNLHNSRFSTDCYISFRHTLGEWGAVKDNLGDALKVYALSVKYDFDKTSNIAIGRKINYRISSMGAIDGVQYEKGFGHFIVGAIGGWRPDYADYGFNPHLFQAGAYIGHIGGKSKLNEETTLAFVEQRNQAKVDRRFVYFQHSNNLSKSLNMFVSFETDIYQYVNNEVTHTPSLTNLLLSLRYKATSKLNFSLSYDNRKNIIYYESYKSYIDQLIDNETRQGLRFGANYRFTKLVTAGFNASWRFQKSDINLSKNINAYLNFNRIPWSKVTASLSANLLQTHYLDSKVYGVRLSREIVRNKLQGEIYYRWVDYQYKNYEYKIQQQTGGIDLSWNLTRKLAFYLYYEGTFDNKNKPFNRINTRIIQRF